MINVVGLPVDDFEGELSFRRPPLSDRSGIPVLIGIGDPVCGPLVGLFYDAPSTPDELAGPPDLTPAHSHPCDNFRVVMRGELIVGQERYRPGEFRLQRTGRPYGRDGDAPHEEGNWRVIFFADRRGHRVRPTNQTLRAQYASPEAMARTKERFGDALPVLLPDEDDGVEGLVSTIGKPFSKLGHVDGSFDEANEWEPVGDGCRVAVSLMGAHDAGPVVILQRTPPGAAATPEVTFESDVFRCVIAGSAEWSDRRLLTGDTVLLEPGRTWEQVVAGPAGLDELIIIGDRRGAVTTSVDDRDRWGSTIDGLIGSLRSRLGELVAS